MQVITSATSNQHTDHIIKHKETYLHLHYKKDAQFRHNTEIPFESYQNMQQDFPYFGVTRLTRPTTYLLVHEQCAERSFLNHFFQIIAILQLVRFYRHRTTHADHNGMSLAP